MRGSPVGAWRVTRQREAIVRILQDTPDFVSARELCSAAQSAGVPVGLTTVYRTLSMLERAGHVDVVRDKNGERLYRSRPADGHRHYLVCRDCGVSQAVDAEPVEAWAAGLPSATGFTRIEHTVELTGVCDDCGCGAAERLHE